MARTSQPAWSGSSEFLAEWVLANCWAEAIGLGTTFVLAGWLGSHWTGEESVTTVLWGAVAAVVCGMLLGGLLIGFAQERGLRRRLSGLRRGRWVLATAVGAIHGAVLQRLLGAVE